MTVTLSDPSNLTLDVIKTIHEDVEMSDYGAPTSDSVEHVSKTFLLDHVFVEEVYWTLLSGTPSGGLSATVNDMILKDYLCSRLKLHDVLSIDHGFDDAVDNLKNELGISCHFVACIRNALKSDGESDYLNQTTIDTLKEYLKIMKVVGRYLDEPQEAESLLKKAAARETETYFEPFLPKVNSFSLSLEY